MLRHVYDVSNIDTQIVYRVWKLDSLIFVIRPKPWYVWAEFYLAGHLTVTDQPCGRYFVILSKDQALAIDFFFLLLYILFLHHENARNVVQGNPKILKFSRGTMPPDPPTSLYLHRPNASPTKNPGYAPAEADALFRFRRHSRVK